ncbi:MAG: response regulator, partial [Desulfobacteraceae bacterium]|nr:response regulator [Desulfobacteraceae bacterium]
TLAGGIAHDFNNILSGIFGYAQIAQMNLADPDKANESIVQIVKGAQRATDLVQQILTFSRQTEHEKVPLRVYIVVKEALKFLRSSIPTSINIVENILSESMIMADATQTHQIVINLCTNAYHSMLESGGTLTVGLTETEITQSSYGTGINILSGKYVKLEINDTGHGMDKITLEKIFDPYYTTKEPDKGTGLGLAVVDGIIKGHHGFIKVDSEVGRGTTFQVFWPIIEEKDLSDISEGIKIDLSKGTEQIMLVDDEKDILVPTQTILEKQGYKVTTFENGLTAYEAFTENPDQFDLVITDITMPKMTGNELSEKILKIRSDMPIILCTGYNEKFTEDKAFEIGVSKYVQKPIPSITLMELTREVLDRH